MKMKALRVDAVVRLPAHEESWIKPASSHGQVRQEMIDIAHPIVGKLMDKNTNFMSMIR